MHVFNRHAIAIGLLVIALVTAARPADALKFSFSYEPIRVYAKPGQVINRNFTLTLAKEEKPTRFRLKMEDWWRSADGNQSFYRPPGTLAHSAANWVRLNPVEATVNPGDTMTVRLSISVPNDIKPGGYWTVLTCDEIPDPTQAPTTGVGVKFTASVSLGVFVYVEPLSRQLKVVDMEVSNDRARVQVENLGNTPLNVEGRLEFLRPGEDKALATTKLARGLVLTEPVTSTILTSDPLPPEATLPSGRYVVRAILDIGLDHYIGVAKTIDIKR